MMENCLYLLILVSASASEIFAAAFQDYGLGLVVGALPLAKARLETTLR